MRYLAHLFVRKVKSFPTWLKRKACRYALENQQRALNQVLDITMVPPAKGKLRKLQQIDVLMMRLFDAFCERHHYRYFLAYGTLLGAIRHGGFIPWDDDVDLMVFLDDFKPLKSKLEKEMRGTRFELYGVESARYDDLTFRISHKDFPSANIDLFLTVPSGKSFSDLAGQRPVLQKFADRQLKRSERLAYYGPSRDILDDYWERFCCEVAGMVSKTEVEEAMSFYGIGCRDSNCYEREVLLPLRRVRFEGWDFPAPNNPQVYLDETIKNWMSFPPRFDHHGDNFLSFTLQEADDMIAYLESCVKEKRFI